jgi:hypothetical protein
MIEAKPSLHGWCGWWSKPLWSRSSAGKIGLITSSVSHRERRKPLAELHAEQLRPVASGQAPLSALMIALLKHVLKL